MYVLLFHVRLLGVVPSAMLTMHWRCFFLPFSEGGGPAGIELQGQAARIANMGDRLPRLGHGLAGELSCCLLCPHHHVAAASSHFCLNKRIERERTKHDSRLRRSGEQFRASVWYISIFTHLGFSII